MKSILVAAILTAFVGQAHASSDICPSFEFKGRASNIEVSSVPASEIDNFVERSDFSDGFRTKTIVKGDELWIDIVEYPGTTTAAAATRIAFIIGRAIKGSPEKIVFADGDKAVFSVPSIKLKDIGCQFSFGEEGGENPIALMREFFSSMTKVDTGKSFSEVFTGNLFADTNSAFMINNEFFVKDWVLSAVN